MSITPIKKGSADSVLALNFEPQIVSVTGGENMEELTNMGYDPEEEEEEEDNDSEEMMIEPDISLDYDDIEELMDENEEDEPESFLSCLFFCHTTHLPPPRVSL